MRRSDDHRIDGPIRQKFIEARKRARVIALGEVAHLRRIAGAIAGIGVARGDAEKV